MSKCKTHGEISVEYDGNIGAPADGYCYQCHIDELKAELEISKRLNTSKGLRDFLNHEDHKKKVQKLRDDQHVNSYKLERDGLRKRIDKYREALQRIASQKESK